MSAAANLETDMDHICPAVNCFELNGCKEKAITGSSEQEDILSNGGLQITQFVQAHLLAEGRSTYMGRHYMSRSSFFFDEENEGSAGPVSTGT